MPDNLDGAAGHLDAKRAHLARLLAAEARQVRTQALSFAQERLWFLDQLAPGTAAYNVVQAFRLDGELHLEALRRSLVTIVERQASLRTTFTVAEGRALQVVGPDGGDRLAVVDLGAVGPAERDREARRLVAEEAERPFDLQQGPLFHATLLRLGELDHVLLLVMHHIVSDGWSVGVLLRELGQLYSAHRVGLDSTLRALPIQYTDFAAWQREQLEGERLKAQLDYWRGQLKGAAPLELPTDRPRPPVQSFRGRRLPFALGRDIREAVRSFAKREGLTPFMTLLAAFQALLQRYSGQGDVVVGSPIASRTRAELEGLIGFFVNTLVLRTDHSGDPTFRELAQRVRRVTLGAYANADVPFERLVDELAPERSLDRNPVFQVLFALQNAPAEPLDLPGLRVVPFEVDRATSKVDLMLSLEERGGGLEGFVEYSTDLFDGGTVERMLGHYERLLSGVVAEPDRRLSELSLLGEEERRRVVVEWNRTGREYPGEAGLGELFRAQAERSPDAVAVVYGEERLSYRELEVRSNQLARHLRGLGVGPESRVGLCVERSAGLVVGMLGIVKAGGAYLPLDPSYPTERLGFMLRDGEVEVVVTQESLRSRLPEHSGRVVSLDAEREAISRGSGEGLESGVCGDSLAYVIYTSGSTGEPKGVCVTHRAVSRLVCQTDYVEFGGGEVVAQASNASFDAATFEIWGPLLHGDRVVGITREVTLQPGEFVSELREHGVTVLFVTTALFNVLARAGGRGLAGLRTLLFGGEAVDPRWVRSVLGGSGPERVLHVYGPTETTTFATWHRVREVGPEAVTVPIGLPIANTTAYVLDARMEPVPIGVCGELYLGGEGLARGYWKRPGLTAERFVPDPFSARPGGRLYRTGDLVRRRADGAIEFVGRVDHQVKVRGFRIELGEIESALLRQGGVKDVVVVAREDEPGERRLVAYVVWGEQGERGWGELREHLRGTLPEYMVPSAFVSLPALPLTPNGKVDRAALPPPENAGAEAGYVAPRTAVEEILAGIFAEVLGRETVGIHDGFFELGGHSLSATRVISRARETFGVEMPLRWLFETPTVAELGRAVEKARAGGGPSVPAITRVDHEGTLPLSFAQQRLWFLDQLEGRSAAYNVPAAFRLTGPLDVEALGRAFEEIQRRHETLRARFTVAAGVPGLGVAEAAVPLARVDLPGRAGEEREAEWRRVSQGLMDEPFDLEREALVRGALLRLAETEHVLLVVVHHIVSDGWSMEIFLREMRDLYAAFRAERPSPLPELAVQYADFAHWQRGWLRGPALESQTAYWKRRLFGMPERVGFPADRPRPARQSFRGGRQTRRLSAGLSRDLRALGRSAGVTLFMTLLAAFKVLLGRHAGVEDVVVGTPIAGRTRTELEGLIGFFVNTLVLRTDLSGRPSFRELLGRVREVALEAYAHQDVPFEKLVEELQPERDLGRNPLFQVMFNFIGLEAAALELEGLVVQALPGPEPTSKFDLTLYARDAPTGIELSAVYNVDLYEPARIAELLDQLERLLSQAVSSPDQGIERLSLVTPAARRVLPEPSTGLERGRPELLTTRVAEEARRAPDAPAIVERGRVWSYGELDRESGRLAGWLRCQGIRPGEVVAIQGHRSGSLVWAMLAVLKSGGAFVILDPAYPALRSVECLRQVRPRGFVQLAAAGPPGEPLEGFAAGLPCRITLPADPSGGGPWSSLPELEPGVGPDIDDVAYVAFTSGSTGAPKGIVGTHRPLSHFLDWHTRHFGLEPQDRFSLLSGLSHDPLLRDVFAPLWVGAALFVPDEGAIAEARVGAWMAGQGVTVAHLTPALGRLIVAGGTALPALRHTFFGGDVLTLADVSRLCSLAPGARCVNYYGATETPQGVAFFEVPDSPPPPGADGQRVPLGKGIADVRLLVLTPAGQPAGIGELGEVHVQTHHLALGYLGDDELTRARFVADPLSGGRAGRLYRTGDLGRYGLGGEVEYVARADDQIKLRGFRIEPAEIEAALLTHPGVSQAAVRVAEDPLGDPKLVAYVVGPDADPAADELRAWLAARVPEHMIPARFVRLEALPLTPNGKVDRRALPPPEWGAREPGNGYLAPRTPVEELLCGIWARLLGVERVSIRDDFFALGGHSLLATQLVSRVRDALGVELPLRALFEQPTVAELAPRVTQILVEMQSDDEIEGLLAEARGPKGGASGDASGTGARSVKASGEA